MGGKVYGFGNAFHSAHMIRQYLESLIEKPIPLSMRTDSKNSFNVITRSTNTSAKRLLMDIYAVGEAYEKEEISDFELVRTMNNSDDASTKTEKCSALEKILNTE